MDNPVMVSVMCKAFNHEKYIRQALDSFVMQKTDFPFEIVVHDDASTDGTADIIREYERKYPDIIKPIYQTENQYSQGKNPSEFMLPIMRGKYVALCEGDDYWTDDTKLQKQVDYMESHPDCTLVGHQGIRVNEQGETISEYFPDTHKADYDIDLHDLDYLSVFHTSSMIFRISFFTDHAEVLQRVEIYDYVYKLLLVGSGKVHVLARPMSAYRMAAKGSWTERVAQNVDRIKEHYEEAIDILNTLNDYFHHADEAYYRSEIRRYRYLVAEIDRDYATLKSPEMKDIYRSKDFMYRLKTSLNLYFPGLRRIVKG